MKFSCESLFFIINLYNMNNERKNKITSKILKFDRKIEIWVIGLWNEIPLLYGLWTVHSEK